MRHADRAERGDHGVQPLGDPLGHGQRGERIGAQRQVPAVLFHAAGGDDGHPAGGEQPGGVRLGHPLDLAVRVSGHRVSLHIRLALRPRQQPSGAR